MNPDRILNPDGTRRLTPRQYLARLDKLDDLLRRLDELPAAADGRPRGDAHWTRAHPEKVPRGEQSGNAVLTEALVLEIRRRHGAGQSQRQIARLMDLKVGTVAMVTARKTWKHVPPEPEVALDPLILHLRRQREAALARLRDLPTE